MVASSELIAMREITVRTRICRMLAAQLKVDEQALTDDFQWLDAIGTEDAGCFLAELDDAFTKLAQGFSFGHGQQPFDRIDEALWKRIASVGGLILHVEEWNAGENR